MFGRKTKITSGPSLAALRDEVEKIARERAGLEAQAPQIEAQIAALAAAHAGAVLESDDAAERNEAEHRRLRYAAQRLAARLAELTAAEAGARQRLADAETAQRRAEAERAVAAAVAELDSVYTPCVEKIAAFLDRWRAACDAARASGIDSPEAVARPRRCERPAEPATFRDETYEAYVNANGNPTDDPFALNDRGERVVPRQRAMFTRRVTTSPAARAIYCDLPTLATSICLPPATWGSPSVNPPARIFHEFNS
ncbi:MAG: hypothetical protein JNK46_09440 [Methylobacteriaceae bacterium]|nr:hypothetical protein [Methylobacteriaceae bacterium]